MARYHPNKTPASQAFTDLVRAALRMAPQALRIGPLLTGDLNLTNTRWQTLGELNDAEHETPPGRLTVSDLARRLGLTRQSVQRLVDGMVEDRFLRMLDNPADARARVAALTAKGRRLYAETQEREWQWTNEIASHFSAAEMKRAAALVEQVTDRMQKKM